VRMRRLSFGAAVVIWGRRSAQRDAEPSSAAA
jgi:hypothetical protein